MEVKKRSGSFKYTNAFAILEVVSVVVDMKAVEEFGRQVHDVHHNMWNKVMRKVNKEEHDKVLFAIQTSKEALLNLTNNFYRDMSQIKK